ncbi:hypothetical protein QKW35_01550 [Pontibacterium granulatum]|uniref:hypothetical protein n=1 Tax=Pontibacterium granulatum TaxID=2036029 RepID=UPI00249C4DB0|nr:hypothetical protein [Pontibacterium granulatum]MDI3323048.1 hypothetical protein [Pontibacterium granulatum]
MKDLTLNELETLLAVFKKAGIEPSVGDEGELLTRIEQAHAERQELESMDFDDCLGGACKL